MIEPGETLEIVGCHAAGEVGDVIVRGVAPPPGATVLEQSQFLAEDQTLRNFVLNEPRGGVFRHVNLLVPAVDPAADIGFIIMEPTYNPLMSGSNSMCVATVVLETGIVTMTEPATTVILEAPGGLVPVEATCRDGKVVAVTITNLASFVGVRDAPLEVEGFGTVRVDTAFGGDSFVLVDAVDLGLSIDPDQAAELARAGQLVTKAANEQLGFSHPEPSVEWNHISFCQIAGPLERTADGLAMRSTTVIDPGKLDRSPTGTGVSARMALLVEQGHMQQGDTMTMRSVIDSTFVGEVAAVTDVAGRSAIVPRITGQAWRTGRIEHRLDATDPWPTGYRLSDTWGR